MKCEWCGKTYSIEDADMEFTDRIYMLSYEKVRKHICGYCAAEAIEDGTEDIYFETCEKCHKKFDYVIDKNKFDSCFSICSGTELIDYWQWNNMILCCDCAMDYV